jgi:hypothetical protein
VVVALVDSNPTKMEERTARARPSPTSLEAATATEA